MLKRVFRLYLHGDLCCFYFDALSTRRALLLYTEIFAPLSTLYSRVIEAGQDWFPIESHIRGCVCCWPLFTNLGWFSLHIPQAVHLSFFISLLQSEVPKTRHTWLTIANHALAIFHQFRILVKLHSKHLLNININDSMPTGFWWVNDCGYSSPNTYHSFTLNWTIHLKHVSHSF